MVNFSKCPRTTKFGQDNCWVKHYHGYTFLRGKGQAGVHRVMTYRLLCWCKNKAINKNRKLKVGRQCTSWSVFHDTKITAQGSLAIITQLLLILDIKWRQFLISINWSFHLCIYFDLFNQFFVYICYCFMIFLLFFCLLLADLQPSKIMVNYIVNVLSMKQYLEIKLLFISTFKTKSSHSEVLWVLWVSWPKNIAKKTIKNIRKENKITLCIKVNK